MGFLMVRLLDTVPPEKLFCQSMPLNFSKLYNPIYNPIAANPFAQDHTVSPFDL